MYQRVIDLLENENDALDLMTINDRLGLTSVDELKELQSILDGLVKDLTVYQTKKNKYILYTKCTNFRKGKIKLYKKGFGFLLLDKEEDIHISKDNLGFALDGDTVLVEIIDPNPERPEGRVIKILERGINNIVGVIKSDGKELYFEPTEKQNITLTIDKKSLSKCVEGEVVAVKLLSDLGKNRYTAEVREHICHKDDPREDILTIAANHDIFPNFSDEAMAQADAMPTEVLDTDRVGRKDLTDKVIFTIDGADTKDIDDAISFEYRDGYYILGVHIADVSYYVTEGSPLDIEAYTRGTSSYLADSVIPQLPHKLSNGICSLNPGVERCAITCEMKIDNRGHVVESDIYPSIIKSRKKMTYTSVNNCIMNDVIDPGYEEFADTLKAMNELAHIIRAERTRRGASDFEIDEPKIICDEEGRAIDVVTRERGDGEKLIEDFMVIANETVASTLFYMDLPSVYRLHGTPKPEKVQAFIQFCASTGHQIKGKFGDSITPSMFQKLLNQIKVDDKSASIYRSLAVRSMPKAYYGMENIGHFGLASKTYTHFTSPIRRYPDLQLHRLIRTYLFNGKMDTKTIGYWETNLPAILKHSSEREVAAQEAEREVDKMKMAEYMENHIGETYDAIISGVASWGIFVQLDNLIEGLIPIDSINDDYYEYDEAGQCLIGRATSKRYTFGDSITVTCVGASKENSQIDFGITQLLKKSEGNEEKKLSKKPSKRS